MPPESSDLRAGEDWPCFLGPQQTGVSRETGLLEAWPEKGPPVVWTKDVGAGYSAPSVQGHRLVLHHREGKEEIVACLRADTGEPLWNHAYRSDFRDPYGYNNGPRCTPLLTEQHCYTLGAEGMLCCLKLQTGEVVWERNVKTEFDAPDGFFGVGATPILEGNVLIVPAGGQPNAGLVGLDALTGKTLWQNVGQSTWDGATMGSSGDRYEWTGEEMIVSYASPIAATIHGRRHVLALMRQGLVSVDPQTGAENFHYWFMSKVFESVNAARPVVVDDTIMISAAYRAGSALLKVHPDGNGVDEVWKDPRNLLTHWSTAIHHDGHYYGFSGRHENEGMLRCIDAKDGRVVWETSGWDGPTDGLRQNAAGEIVDAATGKTIPFPFYGRGSSILVEDKFIVLAERGTLALVKASAEKFEEVSRCAGPRMKYPSWTAPVLSRGRLYLRGEDALVCLDLRQPHN